ncbi:hypothetical protein IFM89_015411 [Coptis chinensis]|uniref:Nucleotide-diphospho-sugar transferase domain-containing protein n=1 Tax=Coptis chinensis TaxID=261450 RepID=A0A835IZ07_9MAGN|nr:hypothetical protein IFM89_015411 [Coptis chinensis]
MDCPTKRVGHLAFVSLLVVGALYIFIPTSDVSKGLLSSKYCQYSSSPKETTTVTLRDELEATLDGVATENKTLIVVILNKAYIEGEKPMLDLFLESFWLGQDTQFLINHLLLVAMDQVAYDRCKFLRLHCYRLVIDGVDYGEEKLFNSRDFINMMWRRTLFLADVLKRGYSFIFTDMDIMWFRNPFIRLGQNESGDIQISVDKFNGNPWSTNNHINAGFYFVKSNNKTISLFETWNAMRNYSNYKGMNEQDVLQKMMRIGMFKKLGLRVRFLDTLFFSGFCQNSKNFSVVATVHANCCPRIDAKVADLSIVLRDWRSYRTMVDDSKKRLSGSTNDMSTLRWSKHVACITSMRNFNRASLS